MKNLLAVCLLLIVSQALGRDLKGWSRKDDGDLKPNQQELDPAHLPMNSAAEVGTTVTLECGVLNAGNPHSVQWIEFAHTPTGGLISDNDVILGHPERDRYAIDNVVPGRYNLVISNVGLADGGMYLCVDSQTNLPLKRQHAASLTIVERFPNCTTTINPDGIVLDLAYHTNDCLLSYRGVIVPNMTWSGPIPFQTGYTANNAQVWSGMQFNVTRSMDTLAHQCLTHFTGYFLPVDANVASNVPEYTNIHQSEVMQVRWGPTDMSATPIKQIYEAGDVILCTADAFPEAEFLWQNLRTGQIFLGSSVRIDEAWRGFNQSMRCEARNTIEGTIYSQQYFLAVDVAPLTTTTTTTPTTPTTPPLPVSDCADLSGAWVSNSPTVASLCVRLDLRNQGLLTGLLKNGTDTYWVDIVGRSQSNKFDQLGFNGIWPINLGVSSFVGQCHRCFGEEQMLVSVISKNKGAPCGTLGDTRYTSQYLFRRSTTLLCPPIPNFY